MPNPAFSDQPTLYTNGLLREVSDDEGYLAMIDTAAGKPVGTEMLLPLEDGSTVPYVYDGENLWHRGDLKPADVLRKAGQRKAAHRAQLSTHREGSSGS